jgi:hypothetical protein
MSMPDIMSKTFPKDNRQKLRCQFSSAPFVLSRVQVLLSDGSSKTPQKGFTKKSTKNPKPIISRFSFITFLWAFLVRGVKENTAKNTGKTNLTPVLFWPLTHPSTTGFTDFFFGGPLHLYTCTRGTGQPERRKCKSPWRVRLPPRALRLHRTSNLQQKHMK